MCILHVHVHEVVCLSLKLSRSLDHMTQIAICTRVTTSKLYANNVSTQPENSLFRD